MKAPWQRVVPATVAVLARLNELPGCRVQSPRRTGQQLNLYSFGVLGGQRRYRTPTTDRDVFADGHVTFCDVFGTR